MTLDISVGLSRFDLQWTPRPYQWPDLVSKLSQTVRTTETLVQYNRMAKSEQDRCKDVGGYVGGYIKGGRRKPENVMYRQLVTLDLDNAVPGAWDEFTDLYGCAACVYSTHKHTPEKPRLRLCIPLDREVMADEYEAISRRIAGDIGIEQADPTTFQVHRLMYWPSSSSDAEFFFAQQAGEILSADAVLRSYRDWRSVAEWPRHAGEAKRTQRDIKEAGDPLEKPGLIGAFCRAYGIKDVISKYLSNEYVPTSDPNRYSYTGGSTAGGLVIYDDKWAFSHHATDPAGDRLSNAFDLVRLHLFGSADSQVKEGTHIDLYPSYGKMMELAAGVAEVRMEKIRADFPTIIVDDDESPMDLAMTKKGKFVESINNCILILNKDPRIAGKFWMDDFSKKKLAKNGLPWRAEGGEWKDSDEAGLRHFMESEYRIVSKGKIDDALQMTWATHKIHPVREYLNAQKWDGVQRVDTLIIDQLGAEDTPYTRAVTRKALCACVARVMTPGVKFDTVLVLVGPQGIGKSTLIAELGVSWYSDTFTLVKSKEAYEQLQGSWLLELGELAGLRKAEVDEIKHFVSKKADMFRPSYGRNVEYFPRQCVFFGTTNNDEFLQDMTGNRRWWPVRVKNFAAGNMNVDQIWAEAVVLWGKGEPLYLDKEMSGLAAEVQDQHLERYTFADEIEEYLGRLFPTGWEDLSQEERRMSHQQGFVGTEKKTRFCVAEIWSEVLNLDLRQRTRYNTRELVGFLKSLKDWEIQPKTTWSKAYGPTKVFIRK